jgi:AraC family transcriptional regulator
MNASASSAVAFGGPSHQISVVGLRCGSVLCRRGELTLDYAVEKYGAGGVLASSADRGWSGLSAELRSHRDGIIAWKNPRPDTEICVDVRGNGSVITRRAGGIVNRTISERGMIWLTPPGLDGDVVEISDPVPEILHIFLCPDRFSAAVLGVEIDPSLIALLRHDCGFQDPLLAEIGYAIATELQNETSGGRMLAETLATSLAARLVQNHLGGPASQTARAIPRNGLDQRRLARVLDYIETNLEGELTVNHLASIACLSQFHFARAFKAAVGRSPHRYISDRRLERAKALLADGDRPLVDVALALSFSCQANFTRAFRAATGQTPGQYRRKLCA